MVSRIAWVPEGRAESHGRPDVGRLARRRHFIALVILALACESDDVSGPANPPLRELKDDIYNLLQVNDIALPAVVVHGTCIVPFTSLVLPDTIRVDGGKLTLRGNGRYEIYYTWRGETDECTTVFRVHWHRISVGDYLFAGDRILFYPDTAEVRHRPTHYRASTHWDTPEATRDGTQIIADWGPLHFRFVLEDTS